MKKETVEQVQEQLDYNLSDYGYTESQTVELPAKEFIGLMTLLQDVIQEGEIFTFKHPSTFEAQEDYFSQRDMERNLSVLAYTASYFFAGLKNIHLNNVKSGLAVNLKTDGEFTS